jgi:hypothetical protein
MLGIAVHMRMARLHLGLETCDHLLGAERPPLFSQCDLKRDVQKKIAQFASQGMVVSGLDRVCNFVGLFE